MVEGIKFTGDIRAAAEAQRLAAMKTAVPEEKTSGEPRVPGIQERHPLLSVLRGLPGLRLLFKGK